MMVNQTYSASIGWGPREETPEQLAARLIRAVQAIRAISPIFSPCYTASDDDMYLELLDLSLERVAERIAAGVSESDDGAPNPRAGYSLTVYNSDQPKDATRDFSVGIYAGSTLHWSGNSAFFSTGYDSVADPSLVSFSLFQGALLILADAFDASVGSAFSSTLAEIWTRGRAKSRIDLEWMAYLGPGFAHFANPPPSAIVERRSNGGLFMAATDEVFSTDDPEHMAVARDIRASVAAFNALKIPYPGLELPED